MLHRENSSHSLLLSCWTSKEFQECFTAWELLDLPYLIIKLTLHTLYCCLIPSLSRGHHPRHVPYCREQEMVLALIPCSEWDVSSGKPHSVVNLDASRWLLFRIFLKLLINQSKNVDKRQSYRIYDHARGGWIMKGCLSYVCKEFIICLRICKSAHGCICFCIGYTLDDITVLFQ